MVFDSIPWPPMDEGNFPIGLLLICDQLNDPPKMLGNFWALHHCKLFLVQSIYLNFGIGSSFVFPNCQGKFCQSLSSQVKWPSQPSRHGAWHAWHGLEAATGPWLVEYQRGIFKKYILHVYWSRCIAQKLWWSHFKYKPVPEFQGWLVEKSQRPARAGCGVNATYRTHLVRNQGKVKQKKFQFTHLTSKT